MKVLVTGGGGVIGSALIASLRTEGHTPYSVDMDPVTYNPDGAEDAWCQDINKYHWITGILSALKPNVVVHLAEINSIDPFVSVHAIKTNVGATAEVLNGCARMNIRCVVGTWGAMRTPFNATTMSMEMKRNLIGVFSNGNAVINEVRMPSVLHPNYPASSFRAYVNRVFNTVELGQPFVLDACENHMNKVFVCRVSDVVRKIMETMVHRTRTPVDMIGNDTTRNAASMQQLVSLALDVFEAEHLTIYSRDVPETIQAIHPSESKVKVMHSIHSMIKEEWHDFTV